MSEEQAKKTELQPFSKKVKEVRALLEKTKPQMMMALPKHVGIDRMLRTTMTAIQRNPKLLECTQVSLLAAIMQGAQLGLETDGVLGEAYLVPYKKVVQFIPGYKGLMKLARNSREISTIFASEVYRSDQFQFQYGSDSKLHHVPVPRQDEKESGPLIAFYAIAKLKDGNSQFVIMWKYEIDRIRDKSAGYIASQKFDLQTPWDTHYEEMGKKTAIRRLCKYLPATAELQRAIALDEMAEAGIEQGLESIIDITEMTEEPKSKLDELVDAGKKENVGNEHLDVIAKSPVPPARDAKHAAGDPPLPVPEAKEKVPSQANLGRDLYDYCRKKGMTDEVFRQMLGNIGLEDKSEVKSEHMKKLMEEATTWERPKKVGEPSLPMG